MADDLFDLADGSCRSGRLRLRVMSGSGRSREQIDEVGGKAGSVRGNECWMLLAGEIVGNNVAAAIVAGQDEVRTRASKISVNSNSASGMLTESGWLASV